MFKTKSIIAYRAADGATLPDHNTIKAAIEQHQLRPIGAHDEFIIGFVEPVKTFGVAEKIEGFTVICVQKDSKNLPSAAINKLLQEKVEEIKARELRKLPSKERSRLKDEIIFEQLPRALVITKKTYAVIDHNRDTILVCASSNRKAEDILTLLRKALGSLPVVPFSTGIPIKPKAIMTHWVEHGFDDDSYRFALDDECQLVSAEQEGGIIRAKHQLIDSEEIRKHIENGKQVEKLGLIFRDTSLFLLESDLNIKKLMFTDVIQEQQAQVDAESEHDQLHADVLIVFSEIQKIYDAIGEVFGVPGYE